eukprot:gene27277-4584_t
MAAPMSPDQLLAPYTAAALSSLAAASVLYKLPLQGRHVGLVVQAVLWPARMAMKAIRRKVLAWQRKATAVALHALRHDREYLWGTLPPNISIQILGHLDLASLLALRRASRQTYLLISSTVTPLTVSRLLSPPLPSHSLSPLKILGHLDLASVLALRRASRQTYLLISSTVTPLTVSRLLSPPLPSHSLSPLKVLRHLDLASLLALRRASRQTYLLISSTVTRLTFGLADLFMYVHIPIEAVICFEFDPNKISRSATTKPLQASAKASTSKATGTLRRASAIARSQSTAAACDPDVALRQFLSLGLSGLPLLRLLDFSNWKSPLSPQSWQVACSAVSQHAKLQKRGAQSLPHNDTGLAPGPSDEGVAAANSDPLYGESSLGISHGVGVEAGPPSWAGAAGGGHASTTRSSRRSSSTQKAVSTDAVLQSLKIIMKNAPREMLLTMPTGAGLRISNEPQLRNLALGCGRLLTGLHLLDSYPYAGSLDWSALSQLK